MATTPPTVAVTVHVPIDLDLAEELVDIEGSSDAFATLREQIARSLMGAHDRLHLTHP